MRDTLYEDTPMCNDSNITNQTSDLEEYNTYIPLFQGSMFLQEEDQQKSSVSALPAPTCNR